MDVKFSNYRFLRDQLILYKNEEIIELKRNQALLLDFFITNPDGIHSKDVIMDSVWQDKVVSEQVVFQTISQLRAIFGSDAIRTFSKKGYKWELELLKDPAVGSAPIGTVLADKSYQKNNWIKLAIFSIGVLFIVGIFLLNVLKIDKQVTLHLVQHTDSTATNLNNLTQLTKQNIIEDGVFTLELAQKNNSARQLFSAPKLSWQHANIPAMEWLLWTEVYSSSEGIFLNFGLSRDTTYWNGYVYAETKERLAQKLSERLIALHQLGLFSQSTSTLDISTLTKMKHISPDDPDLLLLLANYYLEVQQYDIAITYAQKLANLESSYGFRPYQAKAQWLMAEVYKKRHNYELAINSLNKMSTLLASTPLWPLSYDNISARAWLAYAQHDFDTMYKVLEQGIEFGQTQGDALTLFELHILYSILAKKGGDDHKKYAYLNEAQALLLKHELDESNFAVVYYHFAIFTQDNKKALPYLEKILKLPRTIRNGWIIDHATEMLIDQYIEQQDFSLAMSLLDEQQGTAKYMISLARMYHAQDAKEKSRSYFEKAFELARLQYKTHLAIDSALMLFQLSEQQPEIQAEYLDYLERNANKKWLKKQMNKLTNKL